MLDPVDNTHPALALESLAPRYDQAVHGTYLAALKRAIDDQPLVRNIALAGSYGVGKSSVLGQLAASYSARVINLSLLTLGVEPESVDTASGGNPAAQTTSNRIQKEIVKQLLYQQHPSDTPQSRFRRISRLRWKRETLIAVAGGLLVLAILVAIGAGAPLAAALHIALPTLPMSVRAVIIAVGVLVAGGAGVLLIRLLLQGHFGLEKVTAGPASITLPPRSTSYFDEYLDEIIYFFESNPKRDIVIIEDLDRFNDPGIFESLRSLNGLLNAAAQLEPRNVRFIYAVRDSVFEKLGRDAALVTTDEARAELVRANRTKFFELIVPMVPFITHKNARDLLLSLLTSRGHAISKDLVDLSARHVADMRLIHNIVNEYEVFKRQLLDVPTPVPELDPDRLFAMILFKNSHLADFEAVRHGESSLDRLFRTWRSLVQANLEQLRDDSTRLRRRIASEDAATERAEALGKKLRSQIDALATASGTPFVEAAIRVDGSPVDDASLRTPHFWRELRAGRGEITVTVNSASYYGSPQQMSLPRKVVETLLGASVDFGPEAAHMAEADREKIRRNATRSEFLRRHNWQGLAGRADFTYSAADGEVEMTFQQWAEALLPSRLVVDLVISGYLTSYFALHVSTFYGELIRPDAMTYIMRNVDRGIPDPEYALDGDDVDAILRDQGRSVLTERSMHNVSILDHLLHHRPSDATVVVGRLTSGNTDDQAFIDLYMNAGAAKDPFIAKLAPLSKGIYSYLVDQAPLDPEERISLLDTAIQHRGDLDYDLPDTVRAVLEANYQALPSLTQEQFTAEATVALLVDTGSTLPDVTPLTSSARRVLARTRAFTITASNLQQLSRSENIALDALRTSHPELYSYAVDSLDDYLQAFENSPTTAFTIELPDQFVPILTASQQWGRTHYDRLIPTAAPDCTVEQLSEVPSAAWPALVREPRTSPTFQNVASYIDWAGEVDSSISALLARVPAITDVGEVEQQRRSAVALAIVNAGPDALATEHRVDLALDLDPGVLPASSLKPEAGELMGRLIAEDLLVDDPEAFAARLMVDWATQEYAITKSTAFIDMVLPTTVKVEHIAPLIRSRNIKATIQARLVNNLNAFANVPADAYEAIAESGLDERLTLGASAISMVQAGGARKETVLRLLASAGDRISIDELRQLLRQIGGPYRTIADAGRQRPKITDTSENRTIVERLKSAGIISMSKPDKGQTLRITLHHG